MQIKQRLDNFFNIQPFLSFIIDNNQIFMQNKCLASHLTISFYWSTRPGFHMMPIYVYIMMLGTFPLDSPQVATSHGYFLKYHL